MSRLIEREKSLFFPEVVILESHLSPMFHITQKKIDVLFYLLKPVLMVDSDVTTRLLVIVFSPHETLHEICKFHKWSFQVFINCAAVFIQIKGNKKHAVTQVLWLFLPHKYMASLHILFRLVFKYLCHFEKQYLGICF